MTTRPASLRRHVAALAALLLTAGAAASDASEEPAPRGRVLHVVVVWLASPGDAAARARVIEASRSFERIPGVLSVRAGPPLSGDSPILDASFDVGVVMEFEDADALAAYLAHPRHLAATRDVLRPLSERVVAYDFTLPD